MKLLMKLWMKLFFSKKKVIDQTKNRENVSSLEVDKLLLAQCDLEDN